MKDSPRPNTQLQYPGYLRVGQGGGPIVFQSHWHHTSPTSQSICWVTWLHGPGRVYYSLINRWNQPLFTGNSPIVFSHTAFTGGCTSVYACASWCPPLSSCLLRLFQLATNAEVKSCLHMLVNMSLLLQTSVCMGEHQQAAMWKKMAPLS